MRDNFQSHGEIESTYEFEFLEVSMEFSELQKIAQDTLNERRLSRLATAGTVAAAFLTDK